MLRDSLLPFIKEENRNFWVHIIEGVFFSFGASLVQGPVFSFLLSSLKVTPKQFGFLAMFNGLAVLLPLFLAPRVEMVKRKKRLVWMLGIGQRLPFLIIPVLLILFALEMPVKTAIMIAVVNFITTLIVSVLIAPWMTLVAETIGKDKVGRLFGYREGATNIFRLISAGACTALLVYFTFPLNYAILYFAALASVIMSWLIFSMVDEIPPDSVQEHRKSIIVYFKDLADSVKQNQTFRMFLLYRAINRIGFAALGFYAFTASLVFDAPARYAGIFMGVSSVAGAIGCFVFPIIGEKTGHRKMLTIGSLLHVFAAVVAATAPSLNWFILVMFLSAMGGASLTVSGMAFLLPLAPQKKQVGYITGMMAVMAPIGMAASASSGYIMEVFNHRVLFLGAAVLLLFGLIPLSLCRPEEATVADEG